MQEYLVQVEISVNDEVIALQLKRIIDDFVAYSQTTVAYKYFATSHVVRVVE